MGGGGGINLIHTHPPDTFGFADIIYSIAKIVS